MVKELLMEKKRGRRRRFGRVSGLNPGRILGRIIMALVSKYI